jgi:hypothetical protein
MKNMIKHLKDDKAMFEREAKEDSKMIKKLSMKKAEDSKMMKKMSKKKANGKSKSKMKIAKVMDEFKKGELHSGKGGPVVKKPKQAIAIAISVSKKKRK